MTCMAQLMITTLAERTELIERVYDIEDTWPAFMGADAVANALFHRVAGDFPHFCVMATGEDGSPVPEESCRSTVSPDLDGHR
jgi:hypothetical protein